MWCFFLRQKMRMEKTRPLVDRIISWRTTQRSYQGLNAQWDINTGDAVEEKKNK